MKIGLIYNKAVRIKGGIPVNGGGIQKQLPALLFKRNLLPGTHQADFVRLAGKLQMQLQRQGGAVFIEIEDVTGIALGRVTDVPEDVYKRQRNDSVDSGAGKGKVQYQCGIYICSPCGVR